MRNHGMLIVAAALLMCLVVPGFVLAQCGSGDDHLVDRYRKDTRQAELTMITAEQVLRDKPQAEWTTNEILEYEQFALWVVYAGTLAYMFDGNWEPPAELESLVEHGYIQHWPVNPHNDWEPIQILSIDDGFAAGELFWQQPSSGDGSIRARMTFDLGIYGPDPYYSSYGQAELMEGHEDWATVPEGAVYMLGCG